jgi:3',5'-cyclic AMP phosphodiesterase CpdA
VRTIVHISDLHFGADDERLVSALRDHIREIEPTVVAVSGDLTQRARRSQFAAAARFL